MHKILLSGWRRAHHRTDRGRSVNDGVTTLPRSQEPPITAETFLIAFRGRAAYDPAGRLIQTVVKTGEKFDGADADKAGQMP
jgi:hypothetical protein